MPTDDFLRQLISTLPGVGDKRANDFSKLGIFSLWDLLLHLPTRYEDRTRVQPISSLVAGATAFIAGKIEFIDASPRSRKSMICQINDNTGTLNLRFFHFSARQYATLTPGTTLTCYGEIRLGYHGMEMVHPEYSLINALEAVLPKPTWMPVYPLTQGLNQTVLRKTIASALKLFNQNSLLIRELLPESLLYNLSLPNLIEAINQLHAPDPTMGLEDLTDKQAKFRKRLALEELLAHHLSVKSIKQNTKRWLAPVMAINHQLAQKFIAVFPFALTSAQIRVIQEIAGDCSRQHPMMRLVQGDVGSGKTVVAAYAALLAVASGAQVAIMAPTELLAEQHYRNFSHWFGNFSAHIALLTSQLKGQPREKILTDLANGNVNIIIGTHALFQDKVDFNQLGLVIIDEQHRFGVHQRLALRAKGQQNGIKPHLLVMTATPIPRTLAMLQYADLDISIINELPPGRKPIITSVIPNERRDGVIQRIISWVGSAKQAYWVCTLIEESEVLQCQAAEVTAAQLTQHLPNVRIGLLHGRMKPADKDRVMHAFKAKEIDLLVATTVIEVGVDVPNANLMIIENPERLGLSQLHQLRGRIGRGDTESFCLLLYQSPLSDNARQRLAILRDSQDGFIIAEKDLELRGPGEVMGTRQTGQVNLRIADLDKDADLLDNIATIAETLLTTTPDSIPPIIERWLGRKVHYFEV